jgi:exopolysaccharide production protein ExoY
MAAWGLSGQAPIVFHRRVGQFGETLWVPKLRTMWQHRRAWSLEWCQYLHKPPVPAEKSGPDPRVTSNFAAFCRRHSIDELPQLALVLTGKLSFIGPRPITQAELDDFYGDAQREVLAVRPGLTGLWQVLGRNRLTYPQRRRLDLFFVRRANLRLRAWILLRTARELLFPRAAW